VKLTPIPKTNNLSSINNQPPDIIGDWQAEPIFGKSNLIFTLIKADGLLRISPEITGLSVGERVEVLLL
jgi:molybdopterin biosynthesis enzyme